ncbi:Ribosomal protein L7a [Spironucleus salmonicida]|uniref:60S ribosomal protein L7a n=2 Tax=Spironucleus TaxID=39709 RepID=V6LKX0_9EUKA|nr:Ribosomal protein L7a [Spironucleus salmonicida]|eukprot:EST44386.1 Ribosomal protein L7a [Spironucleus salmonicida]
MNAELKSSKFSKIVKTTVKTSQMGVGVHTQKDLTRYVRWPAYIRIQRQKALLQTRLKVPGAINQFHHPVSKNLNIEILNFAKKYIKETREERKVRITKMAETKTKIPAKASVISGINEVTNLIEKKKAKLVLIANDVDPIELVMWLPSLCHKMQIPYAIIRSKSELGALAGLKTCAVLAIDEIRSEDTAALRSITDKIAVEVNYEKTIKNHGGNTLSLRSQRKLPSVEKH